MELQLSGDQIGQVTQWLGSIKDLVQATLVTWDEIQKLVRHRGTKKKTREKRNKTKKKWQRKTYVFHHAHSFLSLANKLILGLLDLSTSILAQVIQIAVGSRLFASLDRIKHQTGVLDVLTCLSSEHQVGVEGGVPTGQEAGLDLGILGQTSLADLLLGQGVLLQCSGKRILTLGALRKRLRASEGGAGDRVVESLGLGLCRRRRCQGGLGLSGRSCLGQQLNLLVDGTAQVIEGLANVGRVVVGLVGVLGAVRKG